MIDSKALSIQTGADDYIEDTRLGETGPARCQSSGQMNESAPLGGGHLLEPLDRC